VFEDGEGELCSFLNVKELVGNEVDDLRDLATHSLSFGVFGLVVSNAMEMGVD